MAGVIGLPWLRPPYVVLHYSDQAIWLRETSTAFCGCGRSSCLLPIARKLNREGPSRGQGVTTHQGGSTPPSRARLSTLHHLRLRACVCVVAVHDHHTRRLGLHSLFVWPPQQAICRSCSGPRWVPGFRARTTAGLRAYMRQVAEAVWQVERAISHQRQHQAVPLSCSCRIRQAQ